MVLAIGTAWVDARPAQGALDGGNDLYVAARFRSSVDGISSRISSRDAKRASLAKTIETPPFVSLMPAEVNDSGAFAIVGFGLLALLGLGRHARRRFHYSFPRD
jgi:MYXO-CTERM domain-containing protein